MKKKIHILSVLLFISLLPTVLFTACDKDTNCYVDVLVLDEATRKPVSNVIVELYQGNNITDGLNYDTGVTNEEGIYSTHFVAPAIISIRATYLVENNGYRNGSGTVRLVEGETKTAQVTLESLVNYD